MCVWGGGVTGGESVRQRENVRDKMCVCVCVCVCARAHLCSCVWSVGGNRARALAKMDPTK
jgi:hypothetical protein